MAAGLTRDQQEALIGRVRTEVQTAALQELLQRSTDRCFELCVPKPGTSLSSKEQTCLANCLDRYIDTMKTVSQAMMKEQ